jgi:hypothetical protein
MFLMSKPDFRQEFDRQSRDTPPGPDGVVRFVVKDKVSGKNYKLEVSPPRRPA